MPILWRIHRVHHADRDIDVTTAIRFHPVEIALSMLLKIGLVYLLGPPALGIILFEMATGSRPFQGDSTISTLSAVLRDTLAHVDVPTGATAMRVRLEVSDDVGAKDGAAAMIEINDPEGHVRGGSAGYRVDRSAPS